jgi:hypothetical protein
LDVIYTIYKSIDNNMTSIYWQCVGIFYFLHK